MVERGEQMSLYTYRATIDRWIDGDTVDMLVDLGFRITTHQRFRLIGVDTPERGQAGYVEARQVAESVYPPGETVVVSTESRSRATSTAGTWSPFRRWLRRCALAACSRRARSTTTQRRNLPRSF